MAPLCPHRLRLCIGNASRPQGAGFIQYDPTPMTLDEARKLIDAGKTYFDYLKGRVMKVDLGGNDFDPSWYDRDNGKGAAQRAIDTLKASGDVNNRVIASTHKEATTVSAMSTKARLGDESAVKNDTGVVRSLEIGLNDLADHIAPKVEGVLNPKKK